MVSTLYTIGFTKKTAKEFFELLRNAGVRKVVDVRENRTGQLQGFARFPDIEFFLQRVVGATYEHQPLFAPSPEIRKTYSATRNWAEDEKSFCALMEHAGPLNRSSPKSSTALWRFSARKLARNSVTADLLPKCSPGVGTRRATKSRFVI